MRDKIERILNKIVFYSILNRRAYLEEERNEKEILKIVESEAYRDFSLGYDSEFDGIVNLPPLRWDDRILKKCFWLSERIGVLLWGLHLFEEIPPFDTPFEIEEINEVLKRVNKGDDQLKYELRNRRELVEFFEIVDFYSWRVGMYLMKLNRILPPKPYTYENMFNMIMDKAFKKGLVKRNKYNDVIVMNKPFEMLSNDEFFLVAAITKEREKAINILLGQ